MATLIDALMAIDADKIIIKETTDYEVKRLSKILKTPFILKLRPVDPKRMNEIQERAVKMTSKGKYNGTDLAALRMLTLCEGIVQPDLNNAELKKRFGASTPKDMLSKLFLAGEIQQIYEKIQDVSGFDDDEEEEKEEEIKN